VVDPSTILSIAKASPETVVGSYTDASISPPLLTPVTLTGTETLPVVTETDTPSSSSVTAMLGDVAMDTDISVIPVSSFLEKVHVALQP